MKASRRVKAVWAILLVTACAAGAATTDPTGAGSPFGDQDMQPSLSMHYLISLGGLFPTPNSAPGRPVPGGGPTTSSVDPLVGEVALFAGDSNSVPSGWARANGQVLNVADRPALFSILGDTYGGDGQTTFALPDLRGRTAVHRDNRPGGEWPLGEQRGGYRSDLTISVDRMLPHTHTMPARNPPTGSIGGGQPCHHRPPHRGYDPIAFEFAPGVRRGLNG